MVIGGQLLIFCYFGQVVRNKSAQSAINVYQSDWLTFGRRADRRSFVLLMQFSHQVDLSFGAFGMVKLSLETFVEVMIWLYLEQDVIE